MSQFALPVTMPEDKAKELLAKAIHLSEGQKEQVWRAYLEGQPGFTPTVPLATAKNETPWTPMGGPVSQAEILNKVKAGALDIQDAARLLASNGGLKVRYNPATGTISVKGSGQYPWASLYRDQWDKLLAVGDDIRAYIALNEKVIAAAEVAGKAAKAAAKAA